MATEPVAARRRWCFLSEWWSEAFSIGGDDFGSLLDGAGETGVLGRASRLLKYRNIPAATTKRALVNRSS